MVESGWNPIIHRVGALVLCSTSENGVIENHGEHLNLTLNKLSVTRML